MAFSYPHNFHRFFIAYDIPIVFIGVFIGFLPFYRFFIAYDIPIVFIGVFIGFFAIL